MHRVRAMASHALLHPEDLHPHVRRRASADTPQWHYGMSFLIAMPVITVLAVVLSLLFGV